MVRHSRAPQWRGVTTFLAVAWPADAVGRLARFIVATAVLVVAALLIAFASGLVQSPLAPAPPVDAASPVAQVLRFAGSWQGPGLDPLITVPPGIQVKSSNYRGVLIGGTTYYYNLSPHTSFDPLARGIVTTRQIDVVAVVGDPPDRVMIYTLKNPGARIQHSEEGNGLAR